NAKSERREPAIMGPIRQHIGNALQEFAKKNGYMMILDAAKLDGAGLLLAFDEKYDATKDFITFFNARPAATAVK
ncbi:MAG: OmpH family outer membrane protein, partial [Pyrinomonadaceae bacterium]|nr:OmpH family outer membrane protein [Pyrinomonadaceae bacterium]